MSVDSTILHQQAPTGQTTVTASASADTPAKAAQGVADVVNQSGGLIGQTESALAKYPLALIQGVGALLAFLCLCFLMILVCALASNHVAEGYIGAIFSNGVVWAIVAGVILGSAYLIPQKSPVQP